MNTDNDPLWKRVWKTLGIRWLGPRGDGVADAMERFQHGFELGYAASCPQQNREIIQAMIVQWNLVLDSMLRMHPEHEPWVKYERSLMKEIANGDTWCIERNLKQIRKEVRREC